MQVLRKKIAAWSSVVLGQLCLGHRSYFPARQYLDLTTLGTYSHTGTSKTQSHAGLSLIIITIEH